MLAVTDDDTVAVMSWRTNRNTVQHKQEKILTVPIGTVRSYRRNEIARQIFGSGPLQFVIDAHSPTSFTLRVRVSTLSARGNRL